MKYPGERMKRDGLEMAAPAGEKADFSKGYAAVLATVIIWSAPSLFQFYLNRYYEPWSQNFYRYGLACLAIAPLVLSRFARKGGKITGPLFMACLVASIPNVIHQVTQTVALFHMGPGVYAIFARSSVIVTALLALVFFPEERWIIRHPNFQIGTALGLGGAIGVIWFQPGLNADHVAPIGIFVALTASFCWALYGILVKRPSAELGSIRSFGLISFLTSAILLPLTLALGDISTPFKVAPVVNFNLIVSAVLCISLAHTLYFVAIREIGVALSQTLQLLCPAGALALSYFVFGERLTWPQLVSSAVLLFGAFLAMRVKPPVTAPAAEGI